jgi:pimeloyl-ACP methyl ester carboxylesterase
MIDVLHFPAIRDGVSIPGNKKAVLYCSPNAGLIEVVAGMSFSGGNVPGADRENSHDDSWVDYYTESGFDVYAFNYAGYGRSFGTTMCVRSRIEGDRSPGCFARVLRIFRGAFFTFQPTPETLRADGVAVGQHLLSSGGVEQLIVHGESIGGLAASGLARHLSTSPSFGSKVSLLVCDRTFCNLEAVAQRLVGGWSGYAIRCLAPFWNTDVAGDFLASSCPKVVANDAADVIISDAASLKSGIALWKELHRGIAPTKGIGWITETPLQYRMAEWENVCVTDSKYVPGNVLFRSQAPVWPNDKLVSFDEAFHFAACCKRIGKFAKAASRAMPRGEEEEGIGLGDLTLQPLVMQAWVALACCDGLTGATLGIAARRGFDATVAWLCSCLVFGGQSVVSRAEKRMQEHQDSLGSMKIVPEDFEGPKAFGTENGSAAALLPISIPVVLERLVSFLEAGDDTMCQRKFIGISQPKRPKQTPNSFAAFLSFPRIPVCCWHAALHTSATLRPFDHRVCTEESTRQ